MLGSDKTTLSPIETLESAKARFPPLFSFHGMDDTAVEVIGTQKSVQKSKEVLADGNALVELEPGDHGFDTMATLEDPWLGGRAGFHEEGMARMDCQGLCSIADLLAWKRHRSMLLLLERTSMSHSDRNTNAALGTICVS